MKKYFAVLLAFLLLVPVVYAAGQRDLHHNTIARHVISPQSVSNNTPVVGTVIDSSEFGAVEYVIAIGANADNDATFTVLLEDCAEVACNTTNAAVADAYLFGTEAAASWTWADNNAVKMLGYSGSKRYTRITVTPASNTGATVFGVVAIMGYPQLTPTQ